MPTWYRFVDISLVQQNSTLPTFNSGCYIELLYYLKFTFLVVALRFLIRLVIAAITQYSFIGL